MDLLDRLLAHDAWTTRRLIDVTDAHPGAWDREHEWGLRTIRKTIDHIMRNMEVWTDLMREQPIRASAGDKADELRKRLEAAASDLAKLAHEVRERDGWNGTWLDKLDDPPKRKTFGAAIAHVLTHSMHHRAQVIGMLRAHGVHDIPEGDVLSWESCL